MSQAEKDLVDRINQSRGSGLPVKDKLTTNERVLARITDGIYRQPASALRELISNAYDADAKSVTILTDAPRFASIIVRDDGIGLSASTLAHLIKNIGGSAKRTIEGETLEITSPDDPSRSPGGRKLIGKMGIGLFSVSQFTRHFLIITKQKGDAYRLIADITLGSLYNEQRLLSYDKDSAPEIETGSVQIHAEPVAKDEENFHGTEIRLMDLLPRTRGELASRDRWAKIDYEIKEDGKSSTPEPRFHIGRLAAGHHDDGLFINEPALPWNDEDGPATRFQKLVSEVRSLAHKDKELVDLESVCDSYLQMLWTLALSAPLPYLEGHPFDLTATDGPLFYQLDNKSKGQVSLLDLPPNESVRSKLALVAPEMREGDSFNIEIDRVRLSRPIVFRNQPTTFSALKTPMFCVGKCRETFSKSPIELSGGPLDFEAYLFWTPKVLPKQHQGVVVRVGNASGALFDRTFMGYTVSEQTRLRQITAEIFIREGFDGAINLDRESYNFSHPHYQYLVKWLHSALRQLVNKHKEVGSLKREEKREAEGEQQREGLEEKVMQLLRERNVEDVPQVEMLDAADEASMPELRHKGVIALRKSAVVTPSSGVRKSPRDPLQEAIVVSKMKAVTQVLESWGLLKELSFSEQERLIQEIITVTLFESQS